MTIVKLVFPQLDYIIHNEMGMRAKLRANFSLDVSKKVWY